MVYLMRHGLDDERYIGGWSDVGLVDKGIIEVNKAAIFLKKYDIKNIVSSDILRAKETTWIVNKYFNVPVIYSSKLRELDKGLLTGMECSKARLLYPYIGDFGVTDKYPDGESMLDLYNRIKTIISYIIEMDDTLLITHRGVINMIYYILNDMELDMDKKKFNVTHSSIHELDGKKKLIRRIY